MTDQRKTAYLAWAMPGTEAYPFRVILMGGTVLRMVSPSYCHFEPANDLACGLVQCSFPDLPDSMVVRVEYWNGQSWEIQRIYQHDGC